MEGAHRTRTEEFYEVTPCSRAITEINRELQAWERTYNTVRPTKPSLTSLPRSFWLNPYLKERNSSVTNLLDESVLVSFARSSHSRESGNLLRKSLERCCRRAGFPLSRE